MKNKIEKFFIRIWWSIPLLIIVLFFLLSKGCINKASNDYYKEINKELDSIESRINDCCQQ